MKLIIYNNNCLYFLLSYFFLFLSHVKSDKSNQLVQSLMEEIDYGNFINTASIENAVVHYKKLKTISSENFEKVYKYVKRSREKQWHIANRLKNTSLTGIGFKKPSNITNRFLSNSLKAREEVKALLKDNEDDKDNEDIVSNVEKSKQQDQEDDELRTKKTIKDYAKEINEKINNSIIMKTDNALETSECQAHTFKTNCGSTLEFYNNPCIMKGYYDYQEQIKGSGDYNQCTSLIHKLIKNNMKSIISSNSSNHENSNEEEDDDDSGSYKKKKTMNILLLGKEFNSFKIILRPKTNITLAYLKNVTRGICEGEYESLTEKYDEIASSIDSACFNMTYTTVLMDELYNKNELNLIFTTEEERDENLLSIFNRFQPTRVNKVFFLLIFINLIVVITIYAAKPYLVEIINLFQDNDNFDLKRFCHQESFLSKDSPDEKILDGAIASQPVKNYVFENLSKQLRDFSKNENYISFMEYKLFIYNVIKQGKMKEFIKNFVKLIVKVRDEKNDILAHIYLTVTQIFSLLMVAYLSHSILSEEYYYQNEHFQLVFFIYSVVLVGWLYIEFYILTTELELYSVLGFEINSFHDKKFISEQGEEYSQ